MFGQLDQRRRDASLPLMPLVPVTQHGVGVRDLAAGPALQLESIGELFLNHVRTDSGATVLSGDRAGVRP